MASRPQKGIHVEGRRLDRQRLRLMPSRGKHSLASDTQEKYLLVAVICTGAAPRVVAEAQR